MVVVTASFSPSKWPIGCHFCGMLLQLQQRKQNDSCFMFVSTVVFSCVAANVCYYFECYSIICYVDKQHTRVIRYVVLTATALSNVRPIYWVCQHFHYTVMIICLLILVKQNYLKLYRIALIKTHNAQPNY